MATTTFLERYLDLTNSKRIKRTADEIARGLDAEGAAKERIEAFEAEQQSDSPKEKTLPAPKKQKLGDKGRFVIRCQPDPTVDPDFVEALSGKEFKVVLDQKFYSWFENKLIVPYEGDAQMLIEHILDMGIGEIIVQIQFPKDLEEHLRLTAKK